MSAPEVSVVMPVFNRPAPLAEAIRSVLDQDFDNWELLIADDGSDDPETLALLVGLTDARIRVLTVPHSGVPAAVRNAALRAARGEYVAFIDSDDVWLPSKLSTQLSAMRGAPSTGWSYGPVARIDNEGRSVSDAGTRPWVPFESDMVHRLMRIDALVATPTVMMRRDLAEHLGGFDPGQVFAEDYDLWIRAAMVSNVLVVHDKLAKVRVHSDNFSQDRLAAHRGWLRLYGKLASTAGSRRTRRLARQLECRSALRVAQLLARQAGRQAEAVAVMRRHVLRAMADRACWGPMARLSARLACSAIAARER